MILQQLPPLVRAILLFLLGAGIGSLINLAIYQLAIFNPRKISPWSTSDSRPTRPWHHRLPIVGWPFLRPESELHGRGFWIRPLLIELVWGLGLVWFYNWQIGGGLFGGQIDQIVRQQSGVIDVWTHTWFMFHLVLFALLTVATFIDLDEKTIPDWITIPGTLFALLVMVLAPHARLPVVEPGGLGAVTLTPLSYGSPGQPEIWHLQPWAALIAVIVILIWCFALLPKLITFRYGLLKGLRYMWASVVRPPRKRQVALQQQPRQMFGATQVIFGIAVIGSLVVLLVSRIGGESWNALFDGLMGLAMGGGVVWAVRIIAGGALGTEAMGFGDVTLMCMIGAFLGWQPALLVFAFAPFTSIFVALMLLLTTGEQKLAFGPYLCLSALIVVIGWNPIWNAWAAPGVFMLGGTFLLIIIFACLILMAVMLGAWAHIKKRLAAAN